MSVSPSIYIPMDRRQAMARGESLPDHTLGVSLFADISGFTPLTEALAKELGRKRGAEELTKFLNLIYTALIGELHRFGGSVIGFSGDAITCWFTASHGDRMLVTCLRAAACALAMQQVMQQFVTIYTPSGTKVSLAVKVALACGPARRFMVGDPEIQLIDTLAGATLERLAWTEHQANRGEVVASHEIIQELGDRIQVLEWRQSEDHPGHRVALIAALNLPEEDAPWPLLAGEAIPVDQIRRWVHPRVFERESTGQEQFFAELRPATALFLRFSGIDYDRDEQAGEKLGHFIRHLQKIINRYEGTLIQVTIGDKGSYTYSAFGAPIAHDDDSARAVSAALELRELLPELDFIQELQIGISKGLMRVGPYGSQEQRTYGVLGDEVNMAARLMTKADAGEILINQMIAENIQNQFDLRSLGGITVKGKRDPVQVALVLGRLQKPSHQQTFRFANTLVGRESELAQMSALLEETQQSQGRILRLEGPAGVGKSRLCSQLIEQAGQRGVKVAVGTCESTNQESAYASWRQVFRSLLGLDEMTGVEAGSTSGQVQALEAYARAHDAEWIDRLPLLSDLLDITIPETALTAAFDPKVRQGALFSLLTEILTNQAARRPLLILLDDVHWMDEASQNLTITVGRSLSSIAVFMVLTQRPEEPEKPILPPLHNLPNHQVLNLDQLSPQGVSKLVANRLGAEIHPLVASLIQAETQGNPFFVEEVVDALREAGNLIQDASGRWLLSKPMFDAMMTASCLVRSEGSWVLAPGVSLAAIDLGLPDSIQGIVLSRIDKLAENVKLTVKVAAVVGRSFPVEIVRLAHPLLPQEPELARQIQSLSSRDFARLEAVLPRLVYTFKHNITRDVVYDTLLYGQRRQLHRSVGEALETLEPDAVALIAFHTFTAEAWENALPYLIKAGDQARNLFANHEAIEHFKKALICLEHVGSQIASQDNYQIVHLRLGELYANIGEYEVAFEHLEEAVALAHQETNREAEAQACRWMAYISELRSDYPLALEWIDRGLAALEGEPSRAAAELMAIAGLIHNRQGEFELAAARCDRGAQIARQLDQSGSLAFNLNSRGLVEFSRGQFPAAIKYYQQALELYRLAENIHGQALSHNSLSSAYQEMGQWAKADGHLRQARKIFNQVGDIQHTLFADNNLGEIARKQGRLDEALAYYEQALSSLEKLGGSAYVQGVLEMNIGATYARQGSANAARQHLQFSLQCYSKAKSRDYLPETYAYMAQAALIAGELDEAKYQAGQALGLARELSKPSEEALSLRLVGEIAIAEGNLAMAEQHLSASLNILDSLALDYEIARTRLLFAELRCQQGKIPESRRMLELCLPVFERLHALLDLESAQSLFKQLERMG